MCINIQPPSPQLPLVVRHQPSPLTQPTTPLPTTQKQHRATPPRPLRRPPRPLPSRRRGGKSKSRSRMGKRGRTSIPAAAVIVVMGVGAAGLPRPSSSCSSCRPLGGRMMGKGGWSGRGAGCPLCFCELGSDRCRAGVCYEGGFRDK